MSDFTEFVHDQLEQDATFAKIWSAQNQLLGFAHHGAKTLGEMNLTDEERVRVGLLLDHPSFDLAMDGIIRFYTEKRRSQRARAAHRAKRHALVIVRYREELEKNDLCDGRHTRRTGSVHLDAGDDPVL